MHMVRQAGTARRAVRTHHRFTIMLSNTDQAHEKHEWTNRYEFQSSTALYSL